MNKQTTVFVIAALIVGGVIGYGVAGSSSPSPDAISSNAHVMADGSLMENSMDMSDMSMEEMMRVMNDDLAQKTGEDFEIAFLEGMIEHHVGAVDMAQLVLKNTDREELVQMAGDIIEVQTAEIEMMQDWRDTWYQ
jgi:uncharacterized protein (DUF305 family)